VVELAMPKGSVPVVLEMLWEGGPVCTFDTGGVHTTFAKVVDEIPVRVCEKTTLVI
jgi:hypothetical protein